MSNPFVKSKRKKNAKLSKAALLAKASKATIVEPPALDQSYIRIFTLIARDNSISKQIVNELFEWTAEKFVNDFVIGESLEQLERSKRDKDSTRVLLRRPVKGGNGEMEYLVGWESNWLPHHRCRHALKSIIRFAQGLPQPTEPETCETYATLHQTKKAYKVIALGYTPAYKLMVRVLWWCTWLTRETAPVLLSRRLEAPSISKLTQLLDKYDKLTYYLKPDDHSWDQSNSCALMATGHNNKAYFTLNQEYAKFKLQQSLPRATAARVASTITTTAGPSSV